MLGQVANCWLKKTQVGQCQSRAVAAVAAGICFCPKSTAYITIAGRARPQQHVMTIHDHVRIQLIFQTFSRNKKMRPYIGALAFSSFFPSSSSSFLSSTTLVYSTTPRWFRGHMQNWEASRKKRRNCIYSKCLQINTRQVFLKKKKNQILMIQLRLSVRGWNFFLFYFFFNFWNCRVFTSKVFF